MGPLFNAALVASEVSLADVLPAALLNPTLSGDPEVANKLRYDSTAGTLSFIGEMLPGELNFLLNPNKIKLDAQGHPLLDANGKPITTPLTLDATQLAAINQLYTKGQAAAFGADIKVTLSGNLNITSSQIASFDGGSIDLESAPGSSGYMNIGSQDPFSSDSTPKGIYTGHGGNVTVHAAGDVLVNGSRIATYDGGDVTVISDHGKVDAGNGASGFFPVTTSVVNPLTGQAQLNNDRFFGSGIMTLTSPFNPDSTTRVGDISITAAGDILAGSGGVLQIAFNNHDQTGASVSLDSTGGSILASDSGILGRNVNLAAAKNITGIIVAEQNVNINAQQNIAVTALGGGSVNVAGGGTVSGTIVGGGAVNVAGDVTASVISTGGSVSGDTSKAQTGAFNGVAATSAQKTTDDADKTVASSATTSTDDDEKKKRKGAVLAQKVSRVTVILPKKS